MEQVDTTSAILVFLVLLLAENLVYGFGAALRNLNRSEIEQRVENTEDKKSVKIFSIISKPEQYINTVQMIVTIINVVIGAIYLYYLTNLFSKISFFQKTAVIPAIILLVYLVLTFGILIPKKVAARFPEKWAYTFINSAYFIMKLLTPLTFLVAISSRVVLFIFHIKNEDDKGDVTEEEIISMVNEGHEQGVLLAQEAEMITNIFEFRDKEAKDIMTHRNDITAIDGESSIQEALSYMLSESKSRFPVYEENLDNLLGILHIRDAMRYESEHGQDNRSVRDVKEILREVMFIPETKNIDALFREMQQTKTQMAVVIDEYGQTSGIVALEDILEEIVGNIMDEYDEDEFHIKETANKDQFIIEGKTPLEELEEKFGIDFEEEEFDTLNGFMIAKMDKIPDENEQFDIDVDGYNFKILSVKNKMIDTVLVTNKNEP